MAELLTILEIVKRTTEFFSGKGIENPRLNAELLIGHGLGLPRMQLYLQFERPLTPADLETIRPLVRRRGQREPLQYILGETEFFGIKVATDRRALIPRPETELLIDLVTRRLESPPNTVIDLGTGSGAIALALAKFYPEARITGVDTSDEALALAAENATKCGLGERVVWLKSDWFAGVPAEARFDLVIANPPYLTVEETAQATPEVRDYEPRGALTGAGEEGLGDLQVIIAAAPAHLTPGGWLALETGIAQHAALRSLVTDAGFAAIESLADLTGRDRFILARQPAPAG